MRSVINSAALCALALTQIATAGGIASRHAHTHGHVQRRDVANANVPVVPYMSPADVASLQKKNIQLGRNLECGAPGAPSVTIGKKGPYVFQLNNRAKEDAIIFFWSGKTNDGYGGGADAMYFESTPQNLAKEDKTKPDVSHTLKAGTFTYISVNPAMGPTGSSSSGGFAAMFPNDCINDHGQLNTTIGEWTLLLGVGQWGAQSTVDISRLVNMSGRKVEAHLYKCEADAQNQAKQPTCSSTYDQCVYVCRDGSNSCQYGGWVDPSKCPGDNNLDSTSSHGGCKGFDPGHGFIVVDFY